MKPNKFCPLGLVDEPCLAIGDHGHCPATDQIECGERFERAKVSMGNSVSYAYKVKEDAHELLGKSVGGPKAATEQYYVAVQGAYDDLITATFALENQRAAVRARAKEMTNVTA